MKVEGRITADGKYVFPQRGPHPPLVDGYIRDPGDPYTLIPNFIEDCTQRTFRLKVLPCHGCMREVAWYYCEHLEVEVTPVFCNESCWVEQEIKKQPVVNRKL